METLQINKLNALKAHEEANEKGRVLLENLFGKQVFSRKITDRVKTYEDACAILGIHVDEEEFDDMTLDEIAYKKLKRIVRALNEGWTPDYNNTNQRKWYPWFNMQSFSFYVSHFVGSCVGSRLVFHSEELATYAAKQFLGIYKQHFTI